jgi:hypothetical protein
VVLTFNDIDGSAMFCCDGRPMNEEGIIQWGIDVLKQQRSGTKLAGEKRDASTQQATINRDRKQVERGEIVDKSL